MWSQTLTFWYSVCLFLFLFVCTSYCADFAREIWSNLSEEQLLFVYLLKQFIFNISKAPGSQKYFWCLDLFTCKFIQKRFLNSSPKIFSLNFECYFSLSVKKMPSVMSKAFRRGSRYQIGWIFGKNPNMPSSKCVLFWFFSIQFLKKKNIPWTLILLCLCQFHAQKALFKVPKICIIDFWIENAPPPFGTFSKIHPIW